MRQAFGHKCHYLTVRQDEKLSGILPLVSVKHPLFGHSLISTAFCVGGGPLADNEESLQALLTTATDLADTANAKYLELRDTAITDDRFQTRSGTHSGFEREISPDPDACLKQIPRKQRAVVRKALASDLTYTVDRTLDQFYPLHARTFRGHGTPLFPKRYYQALLDAFPEACDVLTVWQGDQALSSVLSFYFRDRVTPYYTGSVAEARSTGANDLMYFRLMEHAAQRGCTVFDFGRSKVDTGPHAFKKNWGFEPRPITNAFYVPGGGEPPNVNPSNPKYKLAIDTWKRLPLPIANFISRFISPGIG